MVVYADAIVHPGTVVVVTFNARVANDAMSRVACNHDLAFPTHVLRAIPFEQLLSSIAVVHVRADCLKALSDIVQDLLSL